MANFYFHSTEYSVSTGCLLEKVMSYTGTLWSLIIGHKRESAPEVEFFTFKWYLFAPCLQALEHFTIL